MYINTAENVLADALSRAVNEKKVMVEELTLNCIKHILNLNTVITHKRSAKLSKYDCIKDAIWEYR